MERALRDPAKILVLPHDREAKRVVDLFGSPEPHQVMSSGIAQKSGEIGVHRERVDKRAVQVEQQHLGVTDDPRRCYGSSDRGVAATNRATTWASSSPLSS